MDGLIERELPDWILTPLQAGVLTLPAAMQLWHAWQLTPVGENLTMPPEFETVLERLHLWQMGREEYPSLEWVQ